MPLTQFNSDNRILQMLQTSWASSLDPVLACKLVNGIMLPNITLAAGANTINHKLQRNPQGWLIVDNNAAVTIYRSQPFNQTTLTLTSSGTAIVSIWVY